MYCRPDMSTAKCSGNTNLVKRCLLFPEPQTSTDVYPRRFRVIILSPRSDAPNQSAARLALRRDRFDVAAGIGARFEAVTVAEQGGRARAASLVLARSTRGAKDAALHAMADALAKAETAVLEANAADLKRAEAAGNGIGADGPAPAEP